MQKFNNPAYESHKLGLQLNFMCIKMNNMLVGGKPLTPKKTRFDENIDIKTPRFNVKKLPS